MKNGSAVPDDIALLAEQQQYYRERAPEYDDWWQRRGRYDLGMEENEVWWKEVAEVTEYFDHLSLGDRMLETAAGTGNWTLYLARRATTVCALDATTEMI
ncbi:class I SAM-dependent methyltransferase, partial [bacterium AH-315-F18]|nr:class I SAM-dependent methyltransferase [bacterium AH-315-F18]